MIGTASRRSTRPIIVLLIAALFATALYASDSPRASAEPVLGGQLFSTGGVVSVEVLPATASLTSELYLFEPGPAQLLATNRDVGTIVEIGPFPVGAELIFGIRVNGNEFRLGPAERNPDDLVHAQVDFVLPDVAVVGFEDLFNGGDLDYDDNVFRFSGRIAPEAPLEIPEPLPLPVVDAGPDQTAVEGDVVSLVASEPSGPGVGALSLVPSVDRRAFPNDPDTSVQVALNGLTNGVVDGSVNLSSFGGEAFNLINVIDVSGSTESDDPGCGGDENGDGRVGSILDCEVLAIVTLNERFATGTGTQTALVPFAGSGVAADVSPVDGLQTFTMPNTDADGDGVVDLEQVVRSVDVGRVNEFTSLRTPGLGTDFGDAVAEACTVAANGPAGRTAVAFMSDGEPFFSRSIDLPCGDVVFRTFAVGDGASCGAGDRLSLQSIADLSGGSCVEISNVEELPEVFALTIAPQVVAARLIVDDGEPVDVSDSFSVDLPSSGELTLVSDLGDLVVGASEVCLEVDVRDAVGVTAVSTCSVLRQSDGTYTYQWRTVEQAGPPVLLVGADTPTPSFVAYDDGRYTFEVIATDNVGQTVTDTVAVAVGNADPVVTISSFDPSVGGIALVSGEFVDSGWDDVHSVRVSWGDGTTTDGVVGVQSSGRGSVFATHVYEEPGTYDVAVTVTDDDGGSGTEALVAPPQITSPAAIWADAAADTAGERAVTFAGSNVVVDGLVHSNASIDVQSCTNSFGGTVRYVDLLEIEEFCGDPTDALALPSVTTLTEVPLALDFADFTPAGDVPRVVPGDYFDKTDRCRDGRWRVHDQDLAPGIYFVDCDVDFINASGEVTIIASGEIRADGDDLDFRPFFGSLLFLSGAVGEAGISVASTNSRYAGALYAIDADVVLDGSANAFVCGIYGDTVTVAGDGVEITGADCGDRPDGSIAAALQPNVALELTTSADVLTPGDTAPFTLTLTNQGATFVVPGVAGLQNIDAAPVTVNDLAVSFETRVAGSDEWRPATDIGAVDVAISPTAAPGVTPGAAGVAGTVIEPNAIATWGFQAIADLAPATIATLTDPAQTTGLRLRVAFDASPGLRVRPLYEIGADFASSVHSQTGRVTALEATFLTSNGLTRSVPLSDLESGAATTEVLDLAIAVPAPIRDGEPSTAYINRLRSIDGGEVVGAVFAAGASDGQRVIAPIGVDSAVVQLPIIDTQKSGPADITSGDLVPWSIRLVNVGSVPAAAVEVLDTFGAETLPVEGVTPAVAAGEVIVATTSTVIPPDITREFTENRADTTWQDANGNVYGPTFGISPLGIFSGPSLRAVLVDELAGDPDGNSLISPGDAIRYTTTITNSGDRPLTGVTVTAPIDPNTTFDAASVVGGTLTSDPTADVIEIAVGELDALSQTTVSWAVTITDPFPEGVSSITSSAAVGSAEVATVQASDPAEGPSSDATETAIVVPFPVFDFDLRGQLETDADNSGFVTPGDTLRYSGEIFNTGNAPAVGAIATVDLGPGLSLAAGSASTDAGTVTETADGVQIDLGVLEPNQPVLFEFDAVIDVPVAIGQAAVAVEGSVVATDVAPVASNDPNTDAPNDATSIALGSTGVPVPGAGGGPGAPPPLTTMPVVSTGAALAVDDSPVDLGTGATCADIGPAPGSTITEPSDITATITASGGATVATWTVLTYPAGQPGGAAPLASGAGDAPAVLATIDPGDFSNGARTILIEVTNSAGAVARCETTFIVETDLALGRFTTTYLDLDVVVGGVPIQVMRTYDTQRRDSVGDFGRGWDLSFGNFTAQTNTEIGAGPWDSEVCRPGFLFFSTLCYTSAESRYVTITWPDGRVESFDLTFEAVGLLSALGVTPKYEPRDGATSTLRAAPGDGAPALGPDGNLTSGFLIGGEVYNPRRFILVDQAGTEYLIDKSTGLVSQTDSSGNSVTIGASGIQSSFGVNVAFARDDLGRITTITDPAGATLNYSYDANGDLVSATDQIGNTTTFGYIGNHYLNEVDDPGDGPSQILTYDDDGNLESITDANGNTVSVSIDPTTRTEIVTSSDGANTTVTSFDDEGNPLTIDDVYDGESHIWTFEYDDRGNPIARTDPLGASTSAVWSDTDQILSFTAVDGGTQTFEYDADDNLVRMVGPDNTATQIDYDDRGLPTRIVDALGGVQALTYDARGNLTVKIDELGSEWRWSYDDAGRLLNSTDPLGAQSSYTYDVSGNISTFTDAVGSTWTYGYDAIGQRVSTTDPLGRVTRYTYDERGNRLTTTDPLGAVHQWEYDGVGNLTAEIDPTGLRTEHRWAHGRLVETLRPDRGTVAYEHDGFGRIVRTTDALGRVVSSTFDAAGRLERRERPDPAGNPLAELYEYDARGLLTGFTNAAGERLSYAYDNFGRLTSTIDALGRTQTREYDALGRVIAMSNGAGERTTMRLDALGRILEIVDPTGASTTRAYDPVGRVLTSTDPLGRTSSMSYDAAGRLISATQPSGAADLRSYDANGRQTSYRSPAGRTTTTSYNEQGLAVRVTDGLGNVSATTYDLAGRALTSTDANGATTSYAYERAGRLSSLTDALGGTVAMTYDRSGQLTSVTDANGGLRRFTYDQAGNLSVERDELGRFTRYAYDAVGRRTSITDPRGETITSTLDAAGQTVTETSSYGTVGITYDAAGRRVSMTDPTGVTSFTYDAAGRTTSVSSPAGVVGSSYDAAGQLRSLATPAGALAYDYTVDGFLQSVTDRSGGVTEFEPNADGQSTVVRRPNGVVTANGYDDAGRLIQVGHTGPLGAIETFDYRLDANGNRVAVTDARGTETYGLDDLNRLTSVRYADGSVESFEYAPGGQRTATIRDGVTTTSTYDQAGQIVSTTSNGATVEYTWDASGNLLSTSDGAAFTWDAYGRNTSTTIGGTTTTATFDGSGVRTIVDGQPQLWDRSRGLPTLLSDPSGDYVHAGGQVLAVESGGATSQLLPDGLGSIRHRVDGAGTPQADADFSAFGETQGAASIFGFAGEQTDPTGAVHLRARQYLPDLGQFISHDPIQPAGNGTQAWNYYSYTANNPTTFTDPSGMLASTTQAIAAQAAVAAAARIIFIASLKILLVKILKLLALALAVPVIVGGCALFCPNPFAPAPSPGPTLTNPDPATATELPTQPELLVDDPRPGPRPGPVIVPEPDPDEDEDLPTDDDDDCTSVKGSVHYGPTLPAPSGTPPEYATWGHAIVTPDLIGTGTAASSSIRPPGFVDGVSARRGGAGHNRGHLIGSHLGGSGTTIANLVTLYRNANYPAMYHNVERHVANAARDCEVIDYWATALYSSNSPLPVAAVELQATGTQGLFIHQTILNQP